MAEDVGTFGYDLRVTSALAHQGSTMHKGRIQFGADKSHGGSSSELEAATLQLMSPR